MISGICRTTLNKPRKVDYPDVEVAASLDEVNQAIAPMTVIDPDFQSYEDICAGRRGIVRVAKRESLSRLWYARACRARAFHPVRTTLRTDRRLPAPSTMSPFVKPNPDSLGRPGRFPIRAAF